jgi:hypothetical protein
VSSVSSSQPVTCTDPHPARIRVFYATIKVKKGNFPDYKRVLFDPYARAREAEGFFPSHYAQGQTLLTAATVS